MSKKTDQTPSYSSFFASSSLLHEVREHIEFFSDLDINLHLRLDLSSFDLSEAKDSLARLKKFCIAIDVKSLDEWPIPNHQKFKNVTEKIANRLQEMRNLQISSNDSNPQNKRQGIVSGVEHDVKEFLRYYYPLVTYNAARSLDWKETQSRIDSETEDVLHKIREAHKSATTEIDNTVSGIKRIYVEANETLAEIRDQVAKETAEKQAEHFDTLATEHSSSAKLWLIATIISGVIVIAFAISVSIAHKIVIDGETPFDPAGDYSIAIQLITAKVLLFATLTYFLYMSARNYRSHRHNSVVNSHRANALKTYRAIVEAAGDEPNRNAVLIQAANCIFSPQPTGYGSGDVHEGTSQRAVIEMLSKQVNSSSNTP